MYYFTYDEHTYWHTEPDWEDTDRFSFQGNAGLDITLNGCYRNPPKGCYEKVADGDYENEYGCEEVPVGDIAYVLLVKFQTGGTFGSHEAWCVAGVFTTREKAELHRQMAEGDKPDKSWRPWDGYFERLISAQVEEMPVLEG